MAITIDSYPSQISHFAYRPIIWTVSSNDANIIRCIADLYIDNVLTASIEKSLDIGTTDTFTYDFASAIQDELKVWPPLFAGSFGTYRDTTSSKRYKMRFFEVLDNGTTFDTSWAEDGLGTYYVDSATIYTTAYAFNGGLRHEETQDLTDFNDGGTYAGFHRINKVDESYLGISVPKKRYIKRGDYSVLSGWKNDNCTGKAVFYDEDDNNIGNSTTANENSDNRKYNYVLDTGTFTADTKTFLTRLQNSGGTAITNYVRWEIVEDCLDTVSLYWQNDLGGMDYYLFRDKQVKISEGESESYTKPLIPSYNSYDFSETVLSKNSNRNISCVSEVLNRNQVDALSSLITHANGAWILENDVFIPVIVKDGSITTLNSLDGEYRLNIELKHSNKLQVQRF